jgi:hypothetical protein
LGSEFPNELELVVVNVLIEGFSPRHNDRFLAQLEALSNGSGPSMGNYNGSLPNKHLELVPRYERDGDTVAGDYPGMAILNKNFAIENPIPLHFFNCPHQPIETVNWIPYGDKDQKIGPPYTPLG